MFSIMCQVLEYYFEHFKITMKYSLIFVYSTCPRWMSWEQIFNPNFKVVEFNHFKQEAGLHTFTLSVTDWVDSTNAVGI